MIHFFTTDHHRYTVEDFVDSWMPNGRSEVNVVSYEKWPLHAPLPAGVCIFTDLERLLPFETPLAYDLADALLRQPKHYTVVNAPGRYLGRFNLLKKLHAAGINAFNAVRINESFDQLRYPVFVRNEKDHKGPITELLATRAELDQAIVDLRSAGKKTGHLIVVEFCDCVESDGFYRKYSAVNIAGKLITRHVFLSSDWSTKNADIVSETSLREEREFFDNFSTREQLREIFSIAGVEYGRVDYGLYKGRVQVWEINTNPVIVPRREKIDPRRMETQQASADQIAAALLDLSKRHAPEAVAPFRSPRFYGHKAFQLFARPYRQLKYGRRV